MSSIEWTDETWNPVTGCDRVSPGCKHCYALELAPRLRAMGLAKYERARDGQPPTSGPAFGVTLHPETLEQPRRWRKPRRVFVNSMSDLFHPEVPFDFIREIFDVMSDAEQHTFQILTKRPERIDLFWDDERAGEGWYGFPDNVWIGTSIEMATFAWRAEHIAEQSAGARFISAEPLLGSIAPFLDLSGIDWVIAGGESGSRARCVEADWIRELRDVCLKPCGHCGGTGKAPVWCRRCAGRGRGPAFFFKQWGGRTPKAGGRELDGRTWDEFPAAREVAHV